MKEYDLVKLINEKQYKNNNLRKNMHGIVLKDATFFSSVLFFNPQNIGNYVIVDINNIDLLLEKEKLPNEIKKEIEQNLDKILKKSKSILEPIIIKEYSIVELIAEDEKYSKYGVHKGDRGCVVDNNAVQNYIEVDFSGIDENGNYYGDCISVKIDDLKVIK